MGNTDPKPAKQKAPPTKPKAPPPKPRTLEYVYCSNPACDLHAVGFLDDPGFFKPGSPCPNCQKALEAIVLEARAQLPPGGSSPTATALPGAPYGGFVLQLGDDDDDPRPVWGGTPGPFGPRHDGAHYVAELKRDLHRLGFYTRDRGDSTREMGKFGLFEVACVLDFKRHLMKFYGIATDTNPDMAVWPRRLPTPADTIYFTQLKNPALVYVRWQQWGSAIQRVTGAFKQFRGQWEAHRKSVGRPERTGTADVQVPPVLVDDVDGIGKTDAELLAIAKAPAGVFPPQDSLDVVVKALEKAKKPEERDPIKLRLQALVDRANAVAPRIATMPPLGPGVASGLQHGVLRGRVEQLHHVLSGRLRELKSMESAFATMFMACNAVAEEVETHAEMAKVLAEPPKPFPSWGISKSSAPYQEFSVKAAQDSASKQIPKWLSGELVALENEVSATNGLWTTGVGVPPGWESFVRAVKGIRAPLKAFSDRIAAVSADQVENLFRAYREALREYARVDPATAKHIKTMVATGELNGQKVFLLPMNSEIDKSQPPLEDVVDSMGRKHDAVPMPILNFIFLHESGGKHTRRYEPNEYVAYGTDWRNVGAGTNASFSEHGTDPAQFSMSRGWGFTQKTLFESADPKFEDMDTLQNQKRLFILHSGVPYVAPGQPRPMPATIASVSGNMKSGLTVFFEGFNASARKRDCTFDKRFACAECAKNFDVVPQGFAGPDSPGKPKKDPTGVYMLVDDDKTDFERRYTVIAPGTSKERRVLTSFSLKDTIKLKKLLGTGGGFTLSSLTKAVDDLSVTELDELRVEFPCSWLTANMRYAGTGEQAYAYMLEDMWHLRTKS
ncbi:hypothetical protein [Pendulispora albinea]|uniref:Uncharacterized protein n=1 Tax=Pendulispora albinea TaxID=2741071 RepID=A0ABZ2MBH6_9BACT